MLWSFLTVFSHPIFIRKKNSSFSSFWVSQCWKSFDNANSFLFNDSEKTYVDHLLIYHLLGQKAWRLGLDSAPGFGLRLPLGAGDKFQQVFISAYKLNYKAPETKWGSWANAAALENCVSGSDETEGLTWQTEFRVQWKWLSRMGQKVIHSIESNHRSMIISCLSIGKWKMTGVSFIGSASPDTLLVGHCAEPGLEDILRLSTWECTGLRAAVTGRAEAGQHRGQCWAVPRVFCATPPHTHALPLNASVEVQKAF